MRDRDLWVRMSTYTFDGNAQYGQFADQLARENRWSMEHALAVVEEYRRFLYLLNVARTPVIPPDDVDRAWRTHLAQSQDYWDRMCPEVFGRPLHHRPLRTDVPPSVWTARYEATRALYFQEFRCAAPREVWPDPDLERRQRRIALLVATTCGAAFTGMAAMPVAEAVSLAVPGLVFGSLIGALVVMYRRSRFGMSSEG